MSDDEMHEESGEKRSRETVELLRTELRAPAFPEREVLERIRASIRGLEERSGPPGRPPGRRRTAWTGRWFGLGAAAAASLAIFVGGAEFGRRTALASIPGGSAPGAAVSAPAREADTETLGLPISIQEAGSAYVSRLAQLTARSASLGEGERRMAEEVAWASLRGAATELARLSEHGEALAALILELERGRLGPDGYSHVIRF